MRFATYIFDAKTCHGLSSTVFLHFARPVPSEMKITKISPPIVLGRPGGMRGGAGGDMRGSEICKFEICVMDFCFRSDTPCLGFRPRAADSIAPRIPPGGLTDAMMQLCKDATVQWLIHASSSVRWENAKVRCFQFN